ncbi:hypothetical protein ABTY98_18930 [Streptomyces sp. NPDC096040]|uniref:hypothetical protein n=1 Tax=Streptomyces sp. NPDC096040 TaxID=3155541 RepID=UPI00331A0138
MFVADGDTQGFVERTLLGDGGNLNALRNISKTLSDLLNLLRVEAASAFFAAELDRPPKRS